MRKGNSTIVRLAAFGTVLMPTGARGDTFCIHAPLICSRGSEDTTFGVTITMPTSAPSGTTFTIRVESEPSGRISHLGLNYIYGMTTEYVIPAGLHYVEGSAHVIAGTGTANVRSGARAWQRSGRIFLALPAHVANGDHYTPPSFEFELRADAPVGRHVALAFVRYEVIANAIIVGDVLTHCKPLPAPYRLAVVDVESM